MRAGVDIRRAIIQDPMHDQQMTPEEFEETIRVCLIEGVQVAGLNTAYDYEGIRTREDCILYLDALVGRRGRRTR